MATMPSADEIGEIRAKNGYVYRMTQTDLLWLARAVNYEGGNEAATIWAYAQRAALHKVGNFTTLIRGHSQPVNPLWDEATDAKCVEHPSRCTPAHLERRRQAASASWSSLREEVRELVSAFARGRLPNPVPRAVDFADPTVSQSYLNRNPEAVVVLRDGNWYIANPTSKHWSANYVTVGRPLDLHSSIYIIGDSHTQVLGPKLAPLLGARGWDVLGYTAEPGWSTRRFLNDDADNIGRIVARGGRLPDVALVILGGNDSVASIDAYRLQIAEAVDTLRRLGVKVYWAGPAHSTKASVHTRHERHANWQRQIVPSLGVTWIDSRFLTRSGHAADGVHFTSSGYDKWAQGLARALPEQGRPNPLLAFTPFGSIAQKLLEKA